ncbi:unnamed protein product [Protopolystoma xenopodis]|uniref:Uncharacterized protein n=1 Tax=Protopolystoma xenopodis TaxID=117903 RepID=A0A3S5B297_9PLAT|nr:unnamed protein product [Protopolystoma xenopodis]
MPAQRRRLAGTVVPGARTHRRATDAFTRTHTHRAASIHTRHRCLRAQEPRIRLAGVKGCNCTSRSVEVRPSAKTDRIVDLARLAEAAT